MIQIGYGKSAVISGWMVAPMAVTAMLGKSVVMGILNRLGYRQTLMINTLIIGALICSLAIPDVEHSLYLHIPIIAVLGIFQLHSVHSHELYSHCRFAPLPYE